MTAESITQHLLDANANLTGTLDPNGNPFKVIAQEHVSEFKRFDTKKTKVTNIKGTRELEDPNDVESLIPFSSIKGDSYASKILRAQDFRF